MRLTNIFGIKNTLSILFLLLLTNSSFGISTLELNHIHVTTQQVLDKLYNAGGNYLFLKPKLRIEDTKDKVAKFLPNNKIIILEVSAYKICQSLGRDSLHALAYILGHELAHSFQADIHMHREFTNFLSYSNHFNTTIREEMIADIQGVFMAYLAGYKTTGVVEKVIQKIYEQYDLLDKKMSKYPSYEERLNIAYEVEGRVEELIQFFEAGNYIAALNQYQYASACYEYIEQYYQGEELYNNIGVNLLLHAVNFTDKNADSFLYPLEIEWDTRLKKPQTHDGTKALSIEERLYRIRIIKKAIRQFEKAKKLNFNCFSCDINLLCAYTLLGKQDQTIAYYFNNNLDTRAHLLQVPQKQKEKASLALAIAYADSKNDQSRIQARKIFNELIASKDKYIATIAKYNLEILENKACDIFIPPTQDCISPFNTNTLINGVQVNRFNNKQGKIVNNQNGIQMRYRKYKNSVVFYFIKNEKEFFTFQRVFQPSSKILQLKNEDRNFKSVSTSIGYFLICKETKSIFLVKDNGDIKEWGKYFHGI